MTCVFCKTGETSPGETRIVLSRGERDVAVSGVPADVCNQCGEPYFDENVAENLHMQANAVFGRLPAIHHTH